MNTESRSPYGERGLKSFATMNFFLQLGRSPYGERGLKSRPGRHAGGAREVVLLTESVD